MTEKPLHVRVAEALGWHDLECRGEIKHAGQWTGFPPGVAADDRPFHERWLIPTFDTEWSATGPLIDKYGIGFMPARDQGECVAFRGREIFLNDVAGEIAIEEWASAETPLLAVCNLILALKDAGKL